MKGILERGKHRFVAVGKAQEAWDFIRRNVRVDLLIVELRLKEDSGLSLIQRLKNDCFLKSLPVVVYASDADRDNVKQLLDLRVQNVLIKPYRDDAVFAEIAKGTANSWLQKFFENEKIVCRRKNITPDRLSEVLDSLRGAIEATREAFEKITEKQKVEPVVDILTKLSAKAKAVGALGIVASLKELEEIAAAANWSGFKENLELLDFAAQLISAHLNPTHCPEDYLTEEELNSEKEAQDRAFWANAAEEERCPMVGWDQLRRQIDALSGCPIIDSIAASYQMSANGSPKSLSPLLDLVQKDPGLTAQILIDSNRLKKNTGDGDSSQIEDPRMAVGLLGELRLASLGGNLVSVKENLLLAPPHSSWPNFRMFQLGTARLARFACNYLEMPSLESAAYTAGLMQDLGKLLLIHLHPYAFQAILEYALQHGMKLSSAERFFLGVTTHEIAAYFAEKHGLPRRFYNVLCWMDNPEEANEDAELVAVVSLARDLCRHNHVGFNGDTPMDDTIPLEQTPEWGVLRSRVYINFDLKKFERQAHRECLHLKRELSGKLARSTVA